MMAISSQPMAFPQLDDYQMQSVGGLGDRVTFAVGEELIQQGQKDYPFYVIKNGTVRIVEKRGHDEILIARHGPRSFTGDVDMLTGRSAVITAIADEPVETYRLCAKRLRMVLGRCPKMSDMLLEAFQQRRQLLEASKFRGVCVVGEPEHRETARLREFFYKNFVPHTFCSPRDAEGEQLLKNLGAEDLPLPVVHCNDHTVGNPPLLELAECIGIARNVDGQHFDLTIVGAGPAGLAAAVYAATEGIQTLVIDSVGPGGQAGSSSKIENFIGFPAGLSGNELANRGYLQALKFGAHFIAPVTVESIDISDVDRHRLTLSTGQTVTSRSVLVASGVNYRQLDLPGCREFEGAGIYYAATSVEARVCHGSTAVIVGGGNSAGQAAMFLATTAQDVKLLIRGNDLSKSMSAYLCDRIHQTHNIDVVEQTEVKEIHGSNSVENIVVENNRTGESCDLACAGLFIFIGARPYTDWLPDEVCLDSKGFVLTGSAVAAESAWPLDRLPCELETSVPGILAAGDVRSGTTKRCGFAVGDGALAVACVHRLLSGVS